MRFKSLLLYGIVVCPFTWAADLSTCAKLLAQPINHPHLKLAARMLAFDTELPEAVVRREKCRANLRQVNPGVDTAKVTVSTLIKDKRWWEHLTDFLLFGLHLSPRGSRAIVIDQQRRALERIQIFEAWSIEDLDREIERLVFAELKSGSIAYEALVGWRDLHAAALNATARLIREIKSAQNDIKLAQSDAWTASKSDISYLGQRTTMRIDPSIERVLNTMTKMDFAAETVPGLNDWRRFTQSPQSRKLDAVSAKLNEVEALVAGLSGLVEQRHSLLNNRVRVITDLVCDYVAQAENSVSAPSSAP